MPFLAQAIIIATCKCKTRLQEEKLINKEARERSGLGCAGLGVRRGCDVGELFLRERKIAFDGKAFGRPDAFKL